MPRGDPPPAGRWRLGILIAVAAILAVVALLVLRAGDDAPRPTLTAAEIATLPDSELMRRLHVDLVARRAAGTKQQTPTDSPVQLTLAFEEMRLALGISAALAGGGGAAGLAATYDELGARETATCLRRMGSGQPTAEADRALQQALSCAGLERLRAAWVRGHAEAFAAP